MSGTSWSKAWFNPWAPPIFAPPRADPPSVPPGYGWGTSPPIFPPANDVSQPAPPQQANASAPPMLSGREIGTGEALGRGIVRGVTFGTSPALAGLEEAAKPDIAAIAHRLGLEPKTVEHIFDVVPGLQPIYGAGRLAYDAATASRTPSGMCQRL